MMGRHETKSPKVAGAERADHWHATSKYEDLVLKDRVHGSIYSDPAIFEEELQKIFHRGWVYLGHETEIPKHGDFLLRHIGRQPVIFVHGDDGEIRVLMNRCTHRGAVVCVHERGNSRHFTCPYHGWSFRNTGRLAGVPFEERYDGNFSKSELGLRPVPRSSSYRGFVFVSLSSEGPSLDEHLGPLAKAEIDIALDLSPLGTIEVSAGTHKYGYAGNWKLQLENSVDAYHLNHLHRGFFKIAKTRGGFDGSVVGTGVSPAVVRALPNGHIVWDVSPLKREMQFLGVSATQEEWQQQYASSLVAAHGERHAKWLQSRNSPHILIFPNLVLISSQIRVIRPLSVAKTEVFLSPTRLGGVPEQLNLQRLRGHESFYGPAGGGATDDLEVFERINEGLNATVDPWILISRGLGRETQEADGSISSQITDELSNRWILRHWKMLMTRPE